MNSCRVASVFASGALFVAGAIEACGGDLPKADTRPVASGLVPDADLPSRVVAADASSTDPPGLDVAFFEGRTKLSGPPCSRLFILAAKGGVSTSTETLRDGDVMIVQYPDEMYATAEGLALRVIQPYLCSLRDKPGPVVSLRRAAASRELTWAKGAMHAHLDVGADVSPDLYLGRLSGTASVAEHRHERSTEILVALEAAGTFTIDGKPSRLGNRQIVTVPKNTPHSWTPDPGSSLVAIQLYAPPGPEQRFIGLDAADRDAGPAKSAARRDRRMGGE